MRCFLALFTLLLASNGFAQITLKKGDLPKVGDTLYRNVSTVLMSSFNPGQSSQNATWDASWVKGGEQTMIHFADPALHQYADSMGDANIIQHDEFDFFCEKTDSGYFVMGLLTDPNTLPADEPVERFDTSINFLPIPLTLNDDIVTGGKVSLSLTDPNITLNLWLDITRDMEVVNYGTLKMDNDSTYDVIMIDLLEVREDSTVTIFNGDTTRNANIDSVYYYEFYAKRFGMPLIRAERDPVNDTILAIEYLQLDRVIVGKKEIAAKTLRVYPNPANDAAWLQLPEGSKRVEVLNLMGQVVKEDVLDHDAGLYKLSGLTKGVYLVSVYGAESEPIGISRFTIR